ncbi:SHOCT domain-containing protein, partial [Streptomyces rochei]
ARPGRRERTASRGSWRRPWSGPVLGHRFASGEIDEDEYWRRLSVLDERFGRTGKGGAA